MSYPTGKSQRLVKHTQYKKEGLVNITAWSSRVSGSRVATRISRAPAVVGSLTIAMVVAAIVLALVVEPARATFPGDNGRIVFVSDRNTTSFPNPGGDDEIYTMNPDGNGVQRLTDNTADDIDPAFSPDGKQIAFSSDRDDAGTNPNLKNFEIYTIDAAPESATNQPQRLTTETFNPTFDIEPAWSPGGTSIAWKKGSHIHVMNADGSGQTSLTTGAAQGINMEPSWSPLGNGLVFVSQRDGNFEIYSMVAEDTNGDGSGENQTRLTNNLGSDLTPSFSPDATKIVFASFRGGGGVSNIYVKNTSPESATNQPIPLTSGLTGDSDPVFSPDSKKIAFASSRNGNQEIYSMDVEDTNNDGNGENQARLTNETAPDRRPDWQPLLPPNDDFADAQTISGSTASAAGKNTNATREDGEPSHLPSPFMADRSVWYKWTAPATGQATVDICDTDFNNFLAVYTGSALNALTQVTRDDGSCGGEASRVTFGAQAGTTYQIVVASPTFERGNFVLKLAGPSPTLPPPGDGGTTPPPPGGGTSSPPSPPNATPAAKDDAYSAKKAKKKAAPFTVAAPGVLANDSDPDGNPLTAQLVSNPANGTLAFNQDGSFSYTPNKKFKGQDSFVYKATDGKGGSNEATVTVTVGKQKKKKKK